MEFLDQAKEFFNNFFTNFFTLDSIAILVTALISFLLGMLVNRLRLGSRIKKLKNQIKTQENQITALNAKNKNLQEELEFKAADIQRANLELTQAKDRVKILETEKGQLHADLYAANDEIEKLNGSNQSYSAAVEDLNDQILGLKTRNNQLLEEGGVDPESLALLGGDGSAINRLDALEAKLDRMEIENSDLKNRLTDVDNIQTSTTTNIDDATVQRLLALDDKLSGLASENQLLKAELEKVKALQGPEGTFQTQIEDGADRGGALGILGDASDIETTPSLKMDKEVLGEKLLDAEGANIRKDDLAKIEGIGPFIENKLNKIGIYTYDDLAEMDSARIEQVTQDIGFFPGRIERDNWVGQARDLMGDTTPESYGESTVAERIETEVDYIPNNIAADISADSDIANASENDLKMIEGIGPKIEQLLKSNGIMTWQALAESSVERLKEILTEAGNRYKMHNPSTWPDQARLAADGEWEKLKTYQDYLDGGLDKGGAN